MAAGINDAERGDIEPVPFIGLRTEADAPGDHLMGERAFGIIIIIVGGRQNRIGDEGNHARFRPHVSLQLLDHGFAHQTEFVDAGIRYLLSLLAIPKR